MPRPVSTSEYRALAEVRYRLRRFVNFSEGRARAAGVEPQQHQLILAIEGLPESVTPTIRTIAERLQIQHNSAVELVERTARRGLLAKRATPADRRQVLLEVTARGRRVLEKLAVAHRTELASMAPALLDALSALVAPPKQRRRAS